MAKYRKLHVVATESQDIQDMPDDFTRLLWVMLPLGLDREGRGLDNPAWIKSKIFPLRLDVTFDMIQTAMGWYCSKEMVVRYSVNGRGYFWLPTFKMYQGDTNKEADSVYPPPPDDQIPASIKTKCGETPELVKSNSRVGRELVESKSSTDSDSDSYADSNADADSGGAATAAAISQLYDITAHTCEQLYQQVTGQISIPSDQLQRALADLDTVLAHYQGDLSRAAPVGKQIFRRWCGTRGKSGRAYSRTNTGWITWWLEEISPAPEGMYIQAIPTPSLMCGEGQRLKRQAEEHKSDGSFSRVLADYKAHLETCNTCGSGSTAPDVIAEVRKLADQWSTG